MSSFIYLYEKIVFNKNILYARSLMYDYNLF